MNSKGYHVRIIVAILILATPAVGIRIFSNYYDAQYLQPLGLTKENLAAAEEGKNGRGFARIDVHVGWGRDWTGAMTQTRLRQVLATTLEQQTDFYHFEFDDMPGGQIDVTFVVGPNTYGPFAPGRMITGLKSALIALRMTNGPEG
jgi:hypothetical protein